MDIFDTIDQMRREARTKAEADRKAQREYEMSRPSVRMVPDQQEELLDAQKRSRQPAAPEMPGAERKPLNPAQVAERMRHQPTRQQGPPSPAGSNYINPMAHQSPRIAGESLYDTVERKRQEADAARTSEERDIDRQRLDSLNNDLHTPGMESDRR